jgi:hypothetical protein
VGLDFNTIRVVGTDFMQSDDVGDHQAQQDQGYGNDVEAKETVQGGITHHIVTTDG